MSPYKVLMGVNPRHWADSKILNVIADDLVRADLDELRRKVSGKIQTTQSKNKILFDKKRIAPKQFVSGELVLVEVSSIPATGSSKKLFPAFKGPFKIEVVLPNDRYIVTDMRDNKKRKSVVAVDKLKKWVVLNGQEDQPLG